MLRCLLLFLLIPATLCAGQAAAPPQSGPLDDARRLFDQLRYEDALPLLTQLIQDLQNRPAPDADARALKVAALELRARARFGLGDRTGTRDDLTALLLEKPAFTFGGGVTPRLTALLEDVRKATVGTLTIVTEPADAVIEIDGAAVAPGAPVALVAGPHTVAVRRAGHRTVEQAVAVAAGVDTPLSLTLERVSAIIVIFSSPAGVSVSIDGKPVGDTKPGPPPAVYAERIAAEGHNPATFSAPLEIHDVSTGAHELTYRLACHVTMEYRVNVAKPADYRELAVMEPSVGTISVQGSGAAVGTVFLDDVSKGQAPAVLSNVCSGSHTVEVRSPVGRMRTRVELKPGDDVKLDGTLRPAIALLSTSGPLANVAAADVLATVERLYAGSRTVTVFAPGAETVARVMREQRVADGWLARPGSLELTAAQGPDALAESTLRDAGIRVARALDAQAVADVVFTPREGGTGVTLRMLAAGGARPNDVEVYLDSPTRSVAAIDGEPIRLTKPVLALDVLDVTDVDGVVVAGVLPAAGATPGVTAGEVLTAVNGTKVGSGAALERALAETRPGDRVRVGIRDGAGATREVTLTVLAQPRLAAVHDRSIVWNKAAIDLRASLASLKDPLDIAAAQANLAVALMRMGNWIEAKDLLAGVRLADGPGVGKGTILYLQGLCAEALSDHAAALAAFRAAAAVPGALLTEDGPPVAPLAAEAETRLGAGPRRDEAGSTIPLPGA